LMLISLLTVPEGADIAVPKGRTIKGVEPIA
jgi:hypothetical protein